MGDIPPVDDLDDELRRARAAIKQLKHAPMGETAAAARARSCSLIAAQQRLKAAAQQVADPSAARHVNGGSPSAAGGDLLRQLLRVMRREFVKRDAELEKRLASVLDGRRTMESGQNFQARRGGDIRRRACGCARQVNSDCEAGHERRLAIDAQNKRQVVMINDNDNERLLTADEADERGSDRGGRDRAGAYSGARTLGARSRHRGTAGQARGQFVRAVACRDPDTAASNGVARCSEAVRSTATQIQ